MRAVVVAVFVDAVLTVQLYALEVFAHHEVHDAGKGVRTVHGRRAAGQNFDVVDESSRDLVDIRNRDDRIARHQAAAVDQDEGTLRTKTAKIDARGAEGAGEGRRGRAEVGKRARKAVDQAVDAGRALEFHFLLANCRNRRTGIQARLRNARTRHNNGFDLVLRHGRTGCECRDRCRTEQQRRSQTTNARKADMHVDPLNR